MEDVQAPARAGEQYCDVLVIGGGPAGSTAAAMLARAGRDVLLLERDQHPRFHIGESLLPMNLPIFARLGVLEKVHEMSIFKRAADFEADNERGYAQFEFARALGPSPAHAYQVCRADFDAMLFAHAGAAGARTRVGWRVLEVTHRGAREALARVATAAGERVQVHARYVIDASGRDTLLARKRRLLRRNRRHQSAAIFGRFRGVALRPAEDAGNVSIYRYAHGWMWMIPQPGGEMSVGAVCSPAQLRGRSGDKHGFFMRTLQSSPALWARMEGAELIDGKIHATGNYTYDSTRMGGPGWLLVGDAFAFLDPVFSSGVYLAMASAEEAARLVDTALDAPQREAALQRRLERRMRAGLRRFAWYIYRFNTTAMRELFKDPRNVLGIESAVISMLAGDVFDNRRVLRRLHLFRLLHLAHSLRRPRVAWRERRAQRAQARATIA